MAQKLFLSFSGTLKAMAKGTVTSDDLENGIFFCGCARQHAFTPWVEGANEAKWAFNDESAACAAHAILSLALLNAEHDGRCGWKKDVNGNAVDIFARLSAILVANGCKPIAGRDWEYCHPTVRRLLSEVGNDLEVVS